MAASMRMRVFILMRGDILWGLIAGVAILLVLITMVAHPQIFWQRASRANFDANWDCQMVPKSEPVCVRRVPKEPAD